MTAEELMAGVRDFLAEDTDRCKADVFEHEPGRLKLRLVQCGWSRWYRKFGSVFNTSVDVSEVYQSIEASIEKLTVPDPLRDWLWDEERELNEHEFPEGEGPDPALIKLLAIAHASADAIGDADQVLPDASRLRIAFELDDWCKECGDQFQMAALQGGRCAVCRKETKGESDEG